jgi:hypothetical protein
MMILARREGCGLCENECVGGSLSRPQSSGRGPVQTPGSLMNLRTLPPFQAGTYKPLSAFLLPFVAGFMLSAPLRL